MCYTGGRNRRSLVFDDASAGDIMAMTQGEGAQGGGGVDGKPKAVIKVEITDSHDGHCIICTEALDSGLHRPGVGPCEHTGTCGLCYFRLRKIMGDMSCCICKHQLENVYIFPGPDAVQPYRSLNVWGDNAGPGMAFDDQTRMFVPKEFQKEVMLNLQAPICQVATCRSRCKNMQSLRDHLRDRHESFLCEICVENKKVFLGEQTLYTKGKLQRHIEKGEPEIGFFGHPMCKFCQKRFYDTMHLYDHLNKNHMQCDLCEKAGVRHKYYRDYRDLEKHFKAEHFLCDDPGCLEQRFVVFYTDIEYQAHLVSTHPELAVSRKVPVQFKVRGSRAEEEEEENREEATVDLSFELTPDAFPDLSDDAARIFNRRYQPATAAPTARTGQTASAVTGARQGPFTREDFPALGGGGARGGAAVAANLPAFRHAVAPYQSRAAMLHNDRDQWAYPKVEVDRKAKAAAKGPRPSTAAPPPPPPPSSTPAPPQPPPPPTRDLPHEIVQLIGFQSFDDLKRISQELRTGRWSTEEYYDMVIQLVARREVRVPVMRDLLGLLPDGSLKQDIEAVMNTREVPDVPPPQDEAAYPSLSPATPVAPSVPVAPGSMAQRLAPPSAVARPAQRQEDYPVLGASVKPQAGARGGGGGARKPVGPKAGDWSKALAGVVGGPAKKPGAPRMTMVRFNKGKKADASVAERPPEPPTGMDVPPMMVGQGGGGGGLQRPTLAGMTAGVARLGAGWATAQTRGGAAMGERGARGGITAEDFPALPPPPPGFTAANGVPGAGITMVVVNGKKDDDDDVQQAGGGKKKGKKKGPNDLQKLAFNMK